MKGEKVGRKAKSAAQNSRNVCVCARVCKTGAISILECILLQGMCMRQRGQETHLLNTGKKSCLRT